jgi:hypothetical protein
MYIHLKEEEDGSTYWDIAQQCGGDWEHYTLGKSDEEEP